MNEAGQEPDRSFLELVTVLQMQALVALGKIADPAGGETKVELDRARTAIDWLEALERKSRGNLTSEEEPVLRQILTTLRLNYVDLQNKPGAAGPGGAVKSGETAGDIEGGEKS